MEDETRTLRSVSMMNMVDAYKRVLRAIEVHNPDAVSHEDWLVYKMLIDAELEDDA